MSIDRAYWLEMLQSSRTVSVGPFPAVPHACDAMQQCDADQVALWRAELARINAAPVNEDR